jgi:two-component system chemotaxis response regulator CheB
VQPCLRFHQITLNRLNDLSPLSVKEAQEGDRIMEGRVLVAPGGFHMEVEHGYKVSLTKDPPILGLRPAADVMLSSVARLYGKNTICVVLTGLGSDGTKGATLIKSAGGRVIAQNEASGVGYGMPRRGVDAGAAYQILPLNDIAGQVSRLCQNKETAGALL